MLLVKVVPNENVPTFVPPIFPVHQEEGTTETSTKEENTTHDIKLDGAICKKPLHLDVEAAVELMLSAHSVDGDTMRQKYRLQIIEVLPADAIDWETVDWVQAWPFKTTRS